MNDDHAALKHWTPAFSHQQTTTTKEEEDERRNTAEDGGAQRNRSSAAAAAENSHVPLRREELLRILRCGRCGDAVFA